MTNLDTVACQVREKKEQQVGGNPVAAPLVAELEPSPTPKLPSTTVSTIFMSGSKPGEYSTSLVTLTLNPEPARHRRQAEPAPVLATEIPEPLFEVCNKNVSPNSSQTCRLNWRAVLCRVRACARVQLL